MTKQDLFKRLANLVSDAMSRNGCHDFYVPNTPEVYALIEASGARNIHCVSIEQFRAHKEFNDYKPNLSKDGKTIHTQDFVVLEIMMHELKKAEALHVIASGILPNGDHVDGATWEYANKIVGEIE